MAIRVGKYKIQQKYIFNNELKKIIRRIFFSYLIIEEILMFILHNKDVFKYMTVKMKFLTL